MLNGTGICDGIVSVSLGKIEAFDAEHVRLAAGVKTVAVRSGAFGHQEGLLKNRSDPSRRPQRTARRGTIEFGNDGIHSEELPNPVNRFPKTVGRDAGG